MESESLFTDIEPSGYHPFCLEFPAADDVDFKNIVNSMKLEGFHISEPIILYGNQILDGRTRYEAAIVAGVQPLFKYFDGTLDEARRYVFMKNLARRHLKDSQRAALVASMPNLTTKERAEIANVSHFLQRTTDVIGENAPEFLKPVVDGKISPFMLQPVAKSPDIRKEALKYLQKDDIEGLLSLLRGSNLRSFQSFKGILFSIKRSRQLGNMIKFDNIFTEIQKFLNQLDGITELIEHLSNADKGFEQKKLWEHFTVDLQTIVPELQERVRRVVETSKEPPKFNMLKMWNSILDEIKQQSNLLINYNKHFSPDTVQAFNWKAQEEEVCQKFLKFLDDIVKIVAVMQDDSNVEFNTTILNGKKTEVEIQGMRKPRVHKKPPKWGKPK